MIWNLCACIQLAKFTQRVNMTNVSVYVNNQFVHVYLSIILWVNHTFNYCCLLWELYTMSTIFSNRLQTFQNEAAMQGHIYHRTRPINGKRWSNVEYTVVLKTCIKLSKSKRHAAFLTEAFDKTHLASNTTITSATRTFSSISRNLKLSIWKKA
jgi:hypothetical protein